jgi:predicted dithiol-disulfide oxidoreductase (DUF899 family)
MGGGFPWWSSDGGDFNFDYRVSFPDEKAEKSQLPAPARGAGEAPGISVFVKDGSQIYHTYSTY